MALHVAACFKHQSSFYIPDNDPLTYKCLDCVDRSSSSVARDLQRLGVQTNIRANYKSEPSNCKAAFRHSKEKATRMDLLMCCAVPKDTSCFSLEELLVDKSLRDTTLDTGFNEGHGDFDASFNETTLDTAFLENCHIPDGQDASSRTCITVTLQFKANTSCDSDTSYFMKQPLVQHGIAHQNQKHSIAHTMKKIGLYFH
jgi:hypothetical protein